MILISKYNSYSMHLYIFRMHGTAIGQVLLDAGYIEDVMENEGDFLDGNCLYRFCSVLPNQSHKNQKSKTTKSKIYGSYNFNMYTY